MGRLIDADKCPCVTCRKHNCVTKCKKYFEWFSGCDYDVQKVVDILTSRIAEHSYLENESIKSGYNRLAHEFTVRTDECLEVIDIVRKGGVE